jgi:hypothetical protein
MDYGKVFKRSWHMVTRYRPSHVLIGVSDLAGLGERP